MDRAATLTSHPVGPSVRSDAAPHADHAIFTSVRSPMGEGYRIIAASAGIRPEERMEVTRRAPSHGGLSAQCESSLGILGVPLSSGRYCVGLVRHAGREHTARGGLRVHSHFVFLSVEQFARYACDPWLVTAFIAALDGETPPLKPPPNLPPLDLGEGDAQLPRLSPHIPAVEIAWYSNITRSAMAGEPMVACGASLSAGCEQLAWRLLPRVFRCRRAMSIGLAYSPARPVDLFFADRTTDETRRAAAALVTGSAPRAFSPRPQVPSSTIRWIHPSEHMVTIPADGAAGASLEPWLDLMQRTLASGRGAEFVRIADAIDADATPDGLATTASMYDHLERIYTADVELLDQLTQRYAGCATTCTTQTMLLDRLRQAAAIRAKELRD